MQNYYLEHPDKLPWWVICYKNYEAENKDLHDGDFFKDAQLYRLHGPYMSRSAARSYLEILKNNDIYDFGEIGLRWKIVKDLCVSCNP